jgi:ABC-type branched-subunit amino acid transport system ATPase component
MVQRVVTHLAVLDLGQLIADGPTAEVMGDSNVRRAYLGEAV